MIETREKCLYKTFGLIISSEIILPELIPFECREHSVDVTIKKADLFNEWINNSKEDTNFIVKEHLLMFQIPSKAIFLIQNGNEIMYSPLNDTQDEYLRLYILGTCMGAILMQRKILPLHGSAIAIDNKAYAIVGHSGAGKSTLARAFLDRGYQLISDDVIPVTFSENNTPLVTPSYPQQKLWLESLNQFGMSSSRYKPLVQRETKYSVPVSNQFVNEQLPLAGIFELTKCENNDISLAQIMKMERFYTLYNHTYRNFFLSKSGLIQWHFETSAKLVNKLLMYQISRPVSRFTANDLTEIILSKINEDVSVQVNSH